MRSSRLLWLAPSLALALALSGVAHAETLTAEAAVARAAEKNPSLRAAIHDLVASRASASAERASRVPTLNADLTGQITETAPGGISTRISDREGIDTSVAVRYTTDIGTSIEVGTEAGLGWQNQLSGVNASGPSVTAGVYATARQPLLKGAGTDSVLAPIVQAEASQNAAEQELTQTASQTTLEVLNAFWELWYAEQAIAVEEGSLAFAKKQVSDAKAREELVGTGTKLDVLQFETQVASITDSLSQAKATRTTRAITLGRLLGMTPGAATSLTAGGAPPEAQSIPSADLVKNAISSRSPELAALRADLEAARSRVKLADDSDQVRLDIFATVSTGFNWAETTTDPSVSLLGGRPVWSALAGLELELPLGTGRASYELTRAKEQLAASEARYQARYESIEADASSLRVNLAAADEQVALATETVRLSKSLAEGERQRLLIGTGTSSEVVKAEQTARETELRRLRAIVNRTTARLELEHTTGDLLTRFTAMAIRRPS